ncbi:MAG: hypothetical protein JW789_00195 [Candidatus Aenigmarchaeota archaeon]|nr:hypothetical protein [Candidatus Aenigmarchaeota archaeon]
MINPVDISGNKLKRLCIDNTLSSPSPLPYYDETSEILERLFPSDPAKQCVEYALGCRENIPDAIDGIFAHDGNPVHGDIVLYRDRKENKFTHAGVYQANGMVASKFTIGPVFLHNIGDVPLCYGNEVYFSRLGVK